MIKEKIRALARYQSFLSAKRIILYQFFLIEHLFKKYKNYTFLIKFKDTEDRFTGIYKSNYWGNNESVSGYGSSLKFTENLRKRLPNLLQKYSIRSIFDAPCGDLNWMKLLIPKINIKYIGGDIVKDLINSHNLAYKDVNTSFVHIDLIKDKFPYSDLMICRDCLFHLSYKDTRLVLKNFIASTTPYILTTTYKNYGSFSNKDILTGEFRMIDLFSRPYSFDPNPIERIDDWIHPEHEREMCLWSREQIITALDMWKI